MTSRATPGGGANAPRLPAESAAAAVISGTAVTSESHRLDALADEERSSVGGVAEANGVAKDAPERLARGRNARLGGQSRVEPGALHAEHGAAVAGHGGDQRRQATHGRAFAVAKLWVEAQRREAAAREPPRLEIALGMGAVDGAAAAPQAPRRFGGVVGAALARGRRSRQGEEGAGLVERRAKRRRAGTVANEVEQVAMLPLGRIGPLARRAGRCEADEQRAPAGAVEVARDPVAALAAAVGKIVAAHRLGAAPERGGDGGRVHGASPVDGKD